MCPVQVLFPDMFNEHVWEKYFMVARSHQAFYFSQTCSLNMSGKFFDIMGSPEGGTFPRHVHQKFQFFYPIFFLNGWGVGADVSRRLGSQDNRNFRKSWKNGKFSDFLENFRQLEIFQIVKF